MPKRTRAIQMRSIAVAVGVGLFLGIVLGGLAILATQPQATEYVQDKFLSLRFRLAQALPHETAPEFIPTPLAIPTDSPTGVPALTPTMTATPVPAPTRVPTRKPAALAEVVPIQPSAALRGVKHDYQHWNNCGPTTLEMALSYFGRSDSQSKVASATKPNPDDRNVRPDELAAYVSTTGLRSIIRVDGSVDELKSFLSNGLPVIVETALVKQPQGWMGHYRLLIGYDATQFNTMDSYDGPNVKISFENLDADWLAFNRLYLVVYRPAQEMQVRAIVGDMLDDHTMYTQGAARAREESAARPKDAFAQFDLGMSLNGLGQYGDAAAAFDRARVLGLPWRMLWYQFGPYEAYLHTGRYSEVIALADALLRTADDLEESHYYKGLALRAEGNEEQARKEFQAALRYNANYADAQRALAMSAQ